MFAAENTRVGSSIHPLVTFRNINLQRHSLFRKLLEFQSYYNQDRVHASLDGNTRAEMADELTPRQAKIDDFRWSSVCRGLVQLPIAA